MRVIACYSRDTPYEEEAHLLRASLIRAGMPHMISGFPNLGDWYANTAYKARFIRDTRHALNGPLLYVDVDAFVHENCEAYFDGLAAKGVDLGVHYFAGPSGGHNRGDTCTCLFGHDCDRPHRMLSGTLFLGDTNRVRELTQMWCSMNAILREGKCPQGGGQKNLWFLTTCMKDLKIERIPGRFCYVFDKSWAYPRHEAPIIEHTIASRENRGPSVGKANSPRRNRKAELAQLLAG